MNPYEIIDKYYEPGSKLRAILVTHGESVRDKALALAKRHPELEIDADFVSEAAILHDIGIFMTDAPEIMCFGTHAYIEHGFLGAELMRSEGFPRHALVCERHTGTGLTAEYITERGWNIPPHDMRPVSIEEKLICYADKFFSKTRLDTEDSMERARRKMLKIGEESLATFDSWAELFE